MIPPRPPFLAGQQARKEGQPIHANPHQSATFPPEEYPGPRASWEQGWRTMDWRIKHDEGLKA